MEIYVGFVFVCWRVDSGDCCIWLHMRRHPRDSQRCMWSSSDSLSRWPWMNFLGRDQAPLEVPPTAWFQLRGMKPLDINIRYIYIYTYIWTVGQPTWDFSHRHSGGKGTKGVAWPKLREFGWMNEWTQFSWDMMLFLYYIAGMWRGHASMQYCRETWI